MKCKIAGLVIAIIAILIAVKPISGTDEKPAAIPAALLAISKCESNDRQFNADGSVLRGEKNPLDVGRWQINEFYWLKTSQALGLDIYTAQGNEDMAIWIYNNYDVKPWAWSAHCHKFY